MKIKLVDDWKDGWKWISSICMAAAVGIEGVWLALPPDMKSTIPNDWVSVATIVMAVTGFIGRFIDQGLKNVNQPD